MVSIVSANHERLDVGLQRDLAVLSSLAHLGWLTTDQLHALCFPGYTVATVRMSLRYFEAAGWIHRARWRMKASRRSQLWAITLKGRAMVERYLPVTVPHRLPNLARPATALEQEEYRVQLAVRNIAVRLIVEARQFARLAQVMLELPQDALPAPAHSRGPHLPDAVLAIVWQPPVAQPATWLPWLHPASTAEHPIAYPLYVDRIMSVDYLVGVIDAWHTFDPAQPALPLLILHSDERLSLARQALQAQSHLRPVRLSSWLRLEAGISGETWLDASGRACSLQPDMEDEP